MKKILVFLMMTLCIFSFVACKSEVTTDNSKLIETDYAKVILLTGQSNASGISHIEYLSKSFDTDKVAEYTNGYENIKISYNVDWNNNVSDGFVSVKAGQGSSPSLFGPELGFAEKMTEYTNETIYIIKCSYSGSCLDSEWLDGNYNRDGLYNSFIDYVKTEMEKLENAKIVCMLWMQGESDGSLNVQDKYYKNTKKLVNYINADLVNYMAPTGMAFIDAGIADNWGNYKEINNAKERFARTSKLNGYFETSENGLTNNKEPENDVDYAHYDASSEIQLGWMFANKLKEILNR